MKRPWTASDLAKKTGLPQQEVVQQIVREQKAKKAAADKAQAEKERQQFIEFIRKHTGVELQAEFQFHPSRKWRFDFYNVALKICIEIDGGIWQEISGHNSGKGILNSMEKQNEAVCMGWRPIHLTPQQRFTTYIIELIKRLKAE